MFVSNTSPPIHLNPPFEGRSCADYGVNEQTRKCDCISRQRDWIERLSTRFTRTS